MDYTAIAKQLFAWMQEAEAASNEARDAGNEALKYRLRRLSIILENASDAAFVVAKHIEGVK